MDRDGDPNSELPNGRSSRLDGPLGLLESILDDKHRFLRFVGLLWGTILLVIGASLATAAMGYRVDPLLWNLLGATLSAVTGVSVVATIAGAVERLSNRRK